MSVSIFKVNFRLREWSTDDFDVDPDVDGVIGVDGLIDGADVDGTGIGVDGPDAVDVVTPLTIPTMNPTEKSL